MSGVAVILVVVGIMSIPFYFSIKKIYGEKNQRERAQNLFMAITWPLQIIAVLILSAVTQIRAFANRRKQNDTKAGPSSQNKN